MPILIPHGITPTGFGIRQRSANGALRPISPCCGVSMRGPAATCNGCAKNYAEAADTQNCSLGNDVPASIGHKRLERWIRNVTGLEDVNVEIIS